MKIISKLKKLGLIVFTFFAGINSKVFGIYIRNDIADLPPTLYGIPRNSVRTYWGITRLFVIPSILLAGFIIYLKKSRQTKLRKFITIISIIIITIIICYIVNSLIVNIWWW